MLNYPPAIASIIALNRLPKLVSAACMTASLVVALSACTGAVEPDTDNSTGNNNTDSSSANNSSSGNTRSNSSSANNSSAQNSSEPPVVRQMLLQGDTNYDGLINAQDSQTISLAQGVIVLPNIDDDSERCSAFAQTFDGYALETREYITCNDAADNVSNGAADIEDLTPVELTTNSPVNTNANVSVRFVKGDNSAFAKPMFRLMAKRGEQFVDVATQPLTGADINQGTALALEAVDIMRDNTEWDGTAWLEVTLASSGQNTDPLTARLPLKVAPLVTQHDVANAEQVFASPWFDNTTPNSESERFNQAVDTTFIADLNAAVASVVGELTLLDTAGDIWAQDYFEPAFLSRPTVNGSQKIRVALRSANTLGYEPNWQVLPEYKNKSDRDILSALGEMPDDEYFTKFDAALESDDNFMVFREAGAALYSQIRGADSGVVQIERAAVIDAYYDDRAYDSYNSTGNFTSAPPHNGPSQEYPLGRMIYGATPNQRFLDLLAAQDTGELIQIPSAWLLVGHVDEFISFLPSTLNPRGWILAVADPELAIDLLEQARDDLGGSSLVLKDKISYLTGPKTTYQESLDDLLASKEIERALSVSVNNINESLDILRRELSLTDADIVRLPSLFTLHGETNISDNTPDNQLVLGAYFPSTINGLYLGDYVFISPKQHGPTGPNGDILQNEIEARLDEHGVTVRWVDDFNYAHLGVGNIHCVTNSFRETTDVEQWWLPAQ